MVEVVVRSKSGREGVANPIAGGGDGTIGGDGGALHVGREM